MNCYIHAATPATATCQSCGRGLCSPCSTRFTLLRCQHCIIEGNIAVAQKTHTALAVTGIIFLVMFFLVGNLTGPHSQSPELRIRAILGLHMSFTYWGYRFLSAHMPRLFIASPIVWFFYFVLKFVLLASLVFFSGLINCTNQCANYESRSAAVAGEQPRPKLVWKPSKRH